MDLKLTGKTALVTGASKGIGKAHTPIGEGAHDLGNLFVTGPRKIGLLCAQARGKHRCDQEIRSSHLGIVRLKNGRTGGIGG